MKKKKISKLSAALNAIEILREQLKWQMDFIDDCRNDPSFEIYKKNGRKMNKAELEIYYETKMQTIYWVLLRLRRKGLK